LNFGELVIYCRQRLGIQEDDAITQEALSTMVNLSLGSLDEILVTDYEDYHIKTYLATLGGPSNNNVNTNMIPLPPDFFKLRGVDFGSPGQWITIYGFGFQQRNYFNTPYSNMFANYGNQVQRKARVMDTNIVIEPLNLCSGQYQIWYQPKFQWLQDNQALPYDMDTEGFIEYAVAATGEKVYTTLVLPTEGFTAQKLYYEEKVRNAAKNRMSMGPQVMQNCLNRGGGWMRGRRGWGGISQSLDIDSAGDYNALSLHNNEWEKW
jgi:hypothetical protein